MENKVFKVVLLQALPRLRQVRGQKLHGKRRARAASRMSSTSAKTSSSMTSPMST